MLYGCFLISGMCLKAQVLVAHDGYVSFFGKKPLENIRAENHEVVATIDTKTGNVQFHALVKSFHFKKKSIEDAINEKYMESDRHPETDFTGKILNLAAINFNKPGTYLVIVEGNLTFA